MKSKLLSVLLALAFGLPCLGMTGQTASSNLHFYVERESFTAEGTWVPTNPNDRPADETETELDCYRRTGVCIEATADYFSGHPHIAVANFEIVKWDSNGILASSSEAICVTRTIHIGFAAKHISEMRESKLMPADKQKACETVGVPPNEGWTMALKNSEEWEAERNRKHMY